MLLSKSKFFLFIHNPKAGGTAIRTALEPYSSKEHSFWHQMYIPSLERVVDAAHLDKWEQAAVLPFIPTSFAKFMVIRDPIERFLSGFAEHCRQHSRVGLDVNEFIRTEASIGNFAYDWKYVHMKPQWMFAAEKTIFLNHSNLAREWELLCRMLLRIDYVELKPMRQDPGFKPSLDALSEGSKEKLWNLYKKDYLFFAGRFTLPESHSFAQGDTHCDTMNSIHDPALRPFLDESRLNDKQRLAVRPCPTQPSTFLP